MNQPRFAAALQGQDSSTPSLPARPSERSSSVRAVEQLAAGLATFSTLQNAAATFVRGVPLNKVPRPAEALGLATMH